MPDDPMPAGLASELADMRRRLAALERAPRLTRASISDSAGTERVRLGELAGGDFGLEIANAGGLTVYKAGATGVATPRMPMLITKYNEAIIVTSATFVQTWLMVNPYATGDAVHVQTAVGVDAATTGELRCAINIGGTTYSAVKSLAAGTALYYEWKWAPAGLAVGSGPIQVWIEARRVSGAGNLNVYAPNQAYGTTAAEIGATPTGA